MVKILFSAAFIFILTHTSYAQTGDNDPGQSQSLKDMQSEFLRATKNLTPVAMEKDE